MAAPNPLGEKIVAAARTAFDSRKRAFVDVPEWPVDGKPARIWYDPLSMEEHFEYFSYRAAESAHYGVVRVVVMKATDEAGERLFDSEHELAFCKGVSAGVVIRLSSLISGALAPEVAAKN